MSNFSVKRMYRHPKLKGVSQETESSGYELKKIIIHILLPHSINAVGLKIFRNFSRSFS